MNRISIGSVNGLSPIQRQAIIWTNAGLLPIGPLGTDFSEILIKYKRFIYENAFEIIFREMAAILWGDELTADVPRGFIDSFINRPAIGIQSSV